MMSNSKLLGWMVMSTACVFVSNSVIAQAATVDFESTVVGTQFGGTIGNVPGDLVFTEDGVGVHVDNFTVGAFVGFNDVTIGGFTAPSFPTTPATLNNIRLDFDLSGLGGPVTGAVFDYVDFGGDENLVINGMVLELPEFAAAPPAFAGVNISVNPPMGGGVLGQVSLTGPLTSLAIGGQELGIDDVRFRVVPEPASIALGVLAMMAGVACSGRRANRRCDVA